MLVTNATLDALRTTLITDFLRGQDMVQPFADRFVRRVPSSTAFNTYGWMANLYAPFREWLGPRQLGSLAERQFSIYNKTYERSISVKRGQIEDNDLAEPRMIAEGIGMQGRKLPDDLVIDLLQNGHQRKCYDGQFFFDTDHPTDIDGVTGTQRNYWSSSKALTAANLDDVRQTMLQYKGENGRFLGIIPNLLVVPPQLEITAKKLVTAELLNTVYGTNTAAAADSNPYRGVANVLMIPDLGNEPTAWYLAVDSPVIRPLILQERRALAITSKFSLSDDSVFYRDTFDFGGDVRLGAGYGLWQVIAKAVGLCLSLRLVQKMRVVFGAQDVGGLSMGLIEI